ncbi:ABC-type phosphate transport system substrate-binding protein [Microbacterium sp. SORGH_AS 888]|nr:ABC-type phosphate transport system substrate-binding protein [Microbacterium sp. SORGH_AS_0888]
MKFKRFAAVTAALGVMVAGGIVASSANADVVSNSYVMVGSDTLQDAANALANGTTITGPRVRVTASGETIGSFNAFPSTGTGSMIQTKPTGPYFLRPSGSGNGVTALRASITGAAWNGATITGQIDIARSSSGAGSNANADGKLAYIPFGRDAVAYIYTGGTSAWANLTPAQLKQVYEGTLTSIDGVAVTPRLPQVGSGTRSFFLSAIGSPALPAGFDSGNTTAENDATVLGANQIIPFSVASWTAQSTGAAPSTLGGASVSLGSPVSGVAPVSGAGTSTVPNSAYYANTTFGRDTYLVVERARITSGDAKYDPTLAALVNSSLGTSLTNFTATLSGSPRRVKEKFGFLAPSSTAPIYAFATL